MSETNTRGHWAEKARRAKSQRRAAAWMTRAYLSPSDVRSHGGAVEIHLCRLSPAELDSDNLPAALKAVRDGIADALGLDDGDKRLTWRYSQRKGVRGKYGVFVTICLTPRNSVVESIRLGEETT